MRRRRSTSDRLHAPGVAALAVTVLTATMVAGCGAAPSSGPPASVSVVRGAAPGLDVVALPGAAGERIQAAVAALPGIAEAGLKRTGVPGMAIAVVADDQVVYRGGFGVRKAGTTESVTPDTVFQIASLSKPLSATAVAAAIERSGGKLAWNTPIHTLLPDFAFSDPVVTDRATLGDTFSHRTGLATGAGDDLEELGYDRTTILQRLRLQPLDAFRTSYHYSNFGLTTGAEAVARFRGQTWEQVMDELIYRPLGMNNSSSRHAAFAGNPNRAVLHAVKDGKFVPLFDRDPDPQSPAGGVSSTVNDLSQWMRALLRDGRLGSGADARSVFDGAALLPAVTGEIVSRPASTPAERATSYGYGFNVAAQPGGRVALSHSGAFTDGAATAFSVLPDLGLGIVVLTNGAPVGLPESVVGEFLDIVQFGAPTRDWPADLTKVFAPLLAPIGDLVGEKRPAPAAPGPDPAALVGTYANPYFGDLVIARRGDGLEARLGPTGGFRFGLDPWNGDVLAYGPVSENDPIGSLASAAFTVTDGRATAVRLASFDAQKLGTWTRTG